jgi:hypothetical protein
MADILITFWKHFAILYAGRCLPLSIGSLQRPELRCLYVSRVTCFWLSLFIFGLLNMILIAGWPNMNKVWRPLEFALGKALFNHNVTVFIVVSRRRTPDVCVNIMRCLTSRIMNIEIVKILLVVLILQLEGLFLTYGVSWQKKSAPRRVSLDWRVTELFLIQTQGVWDLKLRWVLNFDWRMVESLLLLGCVLTTRKTAELVIIIVGRKRAAFNDF